MKIGKAGPGLCSRRVHLMVTQEARANTKRISLPKEFRGMRISVMAGTNLDFFREAMGLLAARKGCLFTVESVGVEPGSYKIKVVPFQVLFGMKKIFIFNHGLSDFTFRDFPDRMIHFSKSMLEENKPYSTTELYWRSKGVDPGSVKAGRRHGETDPLGCP